MESTGVYWKPVWNVLESHFSDRSGKRAVHQGRSRTQDGHVRNVAVDNQSESQAHRKSSRTAFYVRTGISFCALALLVLHKLYPGLLPSDTIGIGLLVVAVLPWVLSVISEAELPGGWKVKFRE